MLAEAEHTDATYWPLLHAPQSVPAVTPPRQYWSAAHGVLVDGSGQKKPTGQASCWVDPASQ
jgi:hypothetical protein